MNFLITRTDATRLATDAKGIVADKVTNPVLGSVIVTATPAGLDTVSTQSRMGLSAQYTANVREPGKAAIPAADLLMAIKSLPNDVITFSLDTKNLRLTLTAGKSKATIGTHDPADHPGAPTVTPTTSLTVAAPELRRILDRVFLSMAPDTSKTGMDGAYIDDATPGILRIVTTDGAGRLAWCEGPCTGDLPKRAFIPRACVEALRDTLADFAGDVTLAFDRNRSALATIDGAGLTLLLSEVDFPAYRQVIPATFQSHATFDRAAMLDTLTRLSYFDAIALACEFTEDAVRILARKGGDGPKDAKEGTSEVPVTLTGRPLTIGLNGKTFTDLLKSCTSETVTLHMGDALSPGMIESPGDAGSGFIIMPMRLGA